MLSDVRPFVVSVMGEGGITFIKNTIIYEIFRRLYRLLQVLEPPHRRMVFYMQACSVLNSFLATLVLGGFAFLLVVMASPDIISDNKYVSGVYNFLEFENRERFIIFLTAVFVTAFIVFQFAQIGLSIVNHYMNESITNTCSVKLFNYYLSRGYEESVNSDLDEIFHHNNSSGQVISQIINTSKSVIASSINIIIIVIVLSKLDIVVTSMIALIVMSFYTAVYFFLKRRQKFYGRQRFILGKKKVRTLRQGVLGYMEIVMRGKVEEHVYMVKALYEENMEIGRKLMLMNQIPPRLLRSVGMVVLLILVSYITETADNTSNMFSMVIVFVGATLRLLPIVGSFYSTLDTALQDKANYEAVMASLEKANRYRVPVGFLRESHELVQVKREIIFSKVWYSYKKDAHYEVQNMSMSVPAGKLVALCGRSGAGKTTIAKLVSGLVAPAKGDITVDGKSICEDSVFCCNWRKSIAYIPQDPFFSDGSIAMNIAFELDKSNVDYAKVEEAAIQAGLGDVISSLPKGLETEINSRSTLLSGGQLQRVSIARAIYQDSAMLLFDESTSALDAVTEKDIWDTIISLKSDIPLLIIAHGPESIRRADKILLIDHGKLVAEGSPNKLKKTSDLFRSLMYEYDVASENPIEK